MSRASPLYCAAGDPEFSPKSIATIQPTHYASGFPVPRYHATDHSGLAQAGRVEGPLKKTFWAARSGMVVDRFGVPSLIDCEGSGQPPAAQAGRARHQRSAQHCLQETKD